MWVRFLYYWFFSELFSMIRRLKRHIIGYRMIRSPSQYILSPWKPGSYSNHEEELFLIAPSRFFNRGPKWRIFWTKNLCGSSRSIWLSRSIFQLHFELILRTNISWSLWLWNKYYLLSWFDCIFPSSWINLLIDLSSTTSLQLDGS